MNAKSIVGAASVSAIVLSGMFGGAIGASATSATNRIVVTGALSGTLVFGPTTACDIGSSGGQLSAFSTSLSTKKYKNWAVTYQVAKPGKNMKFSGSSATFVLQSGMNAWLGTSGTISVSSNAASVNLTLSNHEGSASGTLHVKGSWTCKNGVAAG